VPMAPLGAQQQVRISARSRVCAYCGCTCMPLAVLHHANRTQLCGHPLMEPVFREMIHYIVLIGRLASVFWLTTCS
jgi:hypothetical protein